MVLKQDTVLLFAAVPLVFFSFALGAKVGGDGLLMLILLLLIVLFYYIHFSPKSTQSHNNVNGNK